MSIDITVSPGSTTKNKTGGWRTFRPSTDLEHCISCGTCARVCPENCIKMMPPLLSKDGVVPPPFQGGAGGGSVGGGSETPLLPKEGLGVVLKPQTDYDFCKGCGLCAEECPVKVIKMELEKK